MPSRVLLLILVVLAAVPRPRVTGVLSSALRLAGRGCSRTLAYSAVCALITLVPGDVEGAGKVKAHDLAALPEYATSGSEHPVHALLRERHVEGSVPGHRSDAWKLGLVIEGGAMRGVVSAGMVTVLESLNLLNTIDVIYGSSAGAVNGAYFLARQAAYGIPIYYEEINSRDFSSRWRLATGRRLVSLEYLLDEVMEKRRPLEWRAVLDSPIPLKIAATSIEAGKAALLTDFDNKEDLKQALRASSLIPMFAGPPVEYRGNRYLDASLFAAIPLDLAIADGCTHILVLQTRPTGSVVRRPSRLGRLTLGRYLGKIDPGLREQFLRRSLEYNKLTSRLREESDKPSRQAPFILGVQPRDARVAPLEKNRRTLLEGALAGATAMRLVLWKEGMQVLETSSHYKAGRFR